MDSSIINNISENVVRVDVNINGQWGNGTGLIVNENGDILTCEHVVHPNGIIPQEISVVKRGMTPTRAEILQFDKYHDLAIVKSEDLKISKGFKRIEYEEIRIGQDCFVLGYPIGLSHLTLTKAIVSAKAKGLIPQFQFEIIQIDSRVNRGNSGGPLFTIEGEIAGIVTMKYVPFLQQIGELDNYVSQMPILGNGGVSFGDFSVTNFINYVNEGIRRMSRALDIVQVGIGWVIPICFMPTVT